MRKYPSVVILLTLLLTLTLSGCETMKGLGKDLGKLGEKIEDAADK